jgi:hypothetical protein
MAINKSILELIIESISDRTNSLESEISHLNGKIYPSKGPQILIDFVHKINKKIAVEVKNLYKQKELIEELTQEQIEIQFYRYSHLIPFLHLLLHYLSGAESKDTPTALIRPLNRLVRKYLSEAEVIFVSGPEFNYSYIDLASQIKTVFGKLFPDETNKFPNLLLVISFPKIEQRNTLLHCIIAHEIGHGIYKKLNFIEDLTKIVYTNIDKNQINNVIHLYCSSIHKNKKQAPLFPSELQIKDMITSQINEVIYNWTEEVASDLFAICILGPAYYFSFIHFIISCQYIDNYSTTHPSPKLRIWLITKFLKNKNLNYLKNFDKNSFEFFSQWEKNTKPPYKSSNPIFNLIISGIISSFIQFSNLILNKLTKFYDFDKELKNIYPLKERVINLIPPNEIIDKTNKIGINSEISSIMNAGWATYISNFDDFKKAVKEKIKDNTEKYEIKKKINELLLKALELSEIQEINRQKK